MKKSVILPLLTVGLLVGAGAFLMGGNGTDPISAEAATSTLPTISVTIPSSNALVSSPLGVSGLATGTWFFEDSAPVKIYNSNHVLIGQGSMHTVSGNWMTTSTVAFTGNISFSAPGTATGTVVFENANPSGLASNAASTTVAVRFATTTTPGTPETGGRMFWFLNLGRFFN